ncbi:MAG: 2TM domain-containing protein [Dehalococcoidia bacterium]|nr:2TM domain-containing protein [Dehalococcoidia bacterium]
MAIEDTEREMTLHRAEKIVAEKIGFYRHLAAFVAVNAVLIAVNMVFSREFYWFVLILAAWGLVLFAHFVSVFAFRGKGFERWRREQVDKETEKLRRTG